MATHVIGPYAAVKLMLLSHLCLSSVLSAARKCERQHFRPRRNVNVDLSLCCNVTYENDVNVEQCAGYCGKDPKVSTRATYLLQ